MGPNRLNGRIDVWAIELVNNWLSNWSLKDCCPRNLNHQKAIIGVNDRHLDKHKRFTIAHERGHCLLHEQEQLHVDRQFRIN